MKVTMKELASNFLLNRQRLIEFALTNANKYGIRVENGIASTSTMFTDILVMDFKAVDNVGRYLDSNDIMTINTIYGWRAKKTIPLESIEWSNDNNDTVIYATPEENGNVMFQIRNSENRYKAVLTLYLTKDKTVDQQRAMYMNALQSVIKYL